MKTPRPLKIISLLLATVLLTESVFAQKIEINFWTERAALRPVILSEAKDLKRPANDGPSILHIQDIHMNLEAQTSIGQKIAELLHHHEVDLIALEGAFDNIDISPFKEFPNQDAVHKAADILLSKKKLSGPIHSLLRFDGKRVPVVGVDDFIHYTANVEAYRKTVERAPVEKERIAIEEKSLREEKLRTFNKTLFAFDAKVEAYRRGSLSIGRYARVVAGNNPTSALGQFLEALTLEEKLDWAVVEAERNQVLSRLLQNANERDRTELAAASQAFRSGQLPQMEFYALFAGLCQRNGIHLAQFPTLNSYFRYVTLSKNIDAENLFRALNEQETLTYKRFAQSTKEQSLIEQSTQLHLTKKLLDFGLTKQEWNEYKTRRQPNLADFERFYDEADIRDGLMAENLFKAIKDHGAKHAVLVTGGFHADGIRKAANGYSYISFVPKLTRIDSQDSSSYLTVFAQEKTPLQKLLSGEKLFLAPPVWDLPTRTALVNETLALDNTAGEEATAALMSETTVSSRFEGYLDIMETMLKKKQAVFSDLYKEIADGLSDGPAYAALEQQLTGLHRNSGEETILHALVALAFFVLDHNADGIQNKHLDRFETILNRWKDHVRNTPDMSGGLDPWRSRLGYLTVPVLMKITLSTVFELRALYAFDRMALSLFHLPIGSVRDRTIKVHMMSMAAHLGPNIFSHETTDFKFCLKALSYAFTSIRKNGPDNARDTLEWQLAAGTLLAGLALSKDNASAGVEDIKPALWNQNLPIPHEWSAARQTFHELLITYRPELIQSLKKIRAEVKDHEPRSWLAQRQQLFFVFVEYLIPWVDGKTLEQYLIGPQNYADPFFDHITKEFVRNSTTDMLSPPVDNEKWSKYLVWRRPTAPQEAFEFLSKSVLKNFPPEKRTGAAWLPFDWYLRVAALFETAIARMIVPTFLYIAFLDHGYAPTLALTYVILAIPLIFYLPHAIRGKKALKSPDVGLFTYLTAVDSLYLFLTLLSPILGITLYFARLVRITVTQHLNDYEVFQYKKRKLKIAPLSLEHQLDPFEGLLLIPEFAGLTEFFDFHHSIDEWKASNPNSILLGLLRHGEATSNVFHEGQTNTTYSPLTLLRGRPQAEAFSEYTREKNLLFDWIGSSRLERASQTIAPYIKRTGHTLHLLWNMREFASVSIGGISLFRMWDVYQNSISRLDNDPLTFAPRGRPFGARLRLLKKFYKKLQTKKEKTFLIATHGRTIHWSLITLLGIPAKKYRSVLTVLGNVKNASLSLLAYDKTSQQWQLLVFNDNSYLPEHLGGGATHPIHMTTELYGFHLRAIVRLFQYWILRKKGSPRKTDRLPEWQQLVPFVGKSLIVAALLTGAWSMGKVALAATLLTTVTFIFIRNNFLDVHRNERRALDLLRKVADKIAPGTPMEDMLRELKMRHKTSPDEAAGNDDGMSLLIPEFDRKRGKTILLLNTALANDLMDEIDHFGESIQGPLETLLAGELSDMAIRYRSPYGIEIKKHMDAFENLDDQTTDEAFEIAKQIVALGISEKAYGLLRRWSYISETKNWSLINLRSLAARFKGTRFSETLLRLNDLFQHFEKQSAKMSRSEAMKNTAYLFRLRDFFNREIETDDPFDDYLDIIIDRDMEEGLMHKGKKGHLNYSSQIFSFLHDDVPFLEPASPPAPKTHQELDREIIDYVHNIVMSREKELVKAMDTEAAQSLLRMIVTVADRYEASPESVRLSDSPQLMDVTPDGKGDPILKLNFELIRTMRKDFLTNKYLLPVTLETLLTSDLIEKAYFYSHPQYIQQIAHYTGLFARGLTDKKGPHAVKVARKAFALVVHYESEALRRKNDYLLGIKWTAKHVAEVTKILGESSRAHDFLLNIYWGLKPYEAKMGSPDPLMVAKQITRENKINVASHLPVGNTARDIIDLLIANEKKEGRFGTPEAFSFLRDSKYYLPEPESPFGLLPQWPQRWFDWANTKPALVRRALVGVLGASEEILFSGVIWAVAPNPMTFTLMSIFSGFVFMWLHFGPSTRRENGLLVRGPPNEKFAFLFSASMRLLFAVLYFNTNPYLALALIATTHGLHNVFTKGPLGITVSSEFVQTILPDDFVRFIRESVRELIDESPEHRATILKMWNGFTDRLKKDPKSAFFEGDNELMRIELDYNDEAYLTLNMKLLTSLFNDGSQDISNAHRKSLKEIFKGSLAYETFYFENKAATEEKLFKVAHDSDLDYARTDFATELDMEARAYERMIKYYQSDPINWDASKLQQLSNEVRSAVPNKPFLADGLQQLHLEFKMYEADVSAGSSQIDAAKRAIFSYSYLTMMTNPDAHLPASLSMLVEEALHLGYTQIIGGAIIPNKETWHFIHQDKFIHVAEQNSLVVDPTIDVQAFKELKVIRTLNQAAQDLTPELPPVQRAFFQLMLRKLKENYIASPDSILLDEEDPNLMSVSLNEAGDPALKINVARLSELIEDSLSDRKEMRQFLSIELVGHIVYFIYAEQFKKIAPLTETFMQMRNKSNGRAINLARTIVAMNVALQAAELEIEIFHGEWIKAYAGYHREKFPDSILANYFDWLARLFNEVDDKKSADRLSAMRTIAFHHFVFAATSEPRGHPGREMMETIMQAEKARGRVKIKKNKIIPLRNDAFDFIHQEKYIDGDINPPDASPGFLFLMMAFREPSASVAAAFAVAMLASWWWSWRQRGALLPEKKIIQMAQQAEKSREPIEKIVERYFKGSPLNMGLGERFSKEPDWAPLFDNRDFEATLRRAWNENDVALSKRQATSLIATLLRRSDKYKTRPDTPSHFIYLVRNQQDINDLDVLSRQFPQGSRLLVLMDANSFNDKTVDNLELTMGKDNFRFDLVPFRFITNGMVQMARLKKYLPQDERDNWTNITIIRPDELDIDAAGLPAEELRQIRTQTLKNFLLGKVALTVDDQLLLRAIISGLVSRRQA